MVVGCESDSEKGSWFFGVLVPKRQHLLEAIGKRWHPQDSDISTERGGHNHFAGDSRNWSELLAGIFAIVVPDIFSSFYVKEGKVARIGGHHDDPIEGTELKASHLNVFLDVDGSDDLKGLLCLSAYPHFVVQAIADEDIDFGFGVLSGDQVGYFSGMLGQVLHFGPIGSVVEGDIAFGVSDDHPFPEEIKVESRYFVRSDIHVDFFDIAIQSRPYLDFIASRREEAESLFDITTSNHSILVSSHRIVIFVVVVETDRFPSKD